MACILLTGESTLPLSKRASALSETIALSASSCCGLENPHGQRTLRPRDPGSFSRSRLYLAAAATSRQSRGRGHSRCDRAALFLYRAGHRGDVVLDKE